MFVWYGTCIVVPFDMLLLFVLVVGGGKDTVIRYKGSYTTYRLYVSVEREFCAIPNFQPTNQKKIQPHKNKESLPSFFDFIFHTSHPKIINES